MVNENCRYYDYGRTAPIELGVFCEKYKTNKFNCDECELKDNKLFYNYGCLYNHYVRTKEGMYRKLSGKLVKVITSKDEDITLVALQDIANDDIYIVDEIKEKKYM